MKRGGADAGGAAFPCDTLGLSSNIDIVIACGKILPGTGSQRSVSTAGGVKDERLGADGSVLVASCAGQQRLSTHRCPKPTVDVRKECLNPHGRVALPVDVLLKRISTDCRIGAAFFVVMHRAKADSGIAIASGIANQR